MMSPPEKYSALQSLSRGCSSTEGESCEHNRYSCKPGSTPKPYIVITCFNQDRQSDTIVTLQPSRNKLMRTELVTTLKRQATKILAELRESKEPILITEHGQPSAYLLDVSDYEYMVRRMEILEGIARGEQDIRENRTMTNADAKEKLSKWLK